MQWVLNRLTALRGVAEPDDIDGEVDDDDCDDDYGLRSWCLHQSPSMVAAPNSPTSPRNPKNVKLLHWERESNE